MNDIAVLIIALLSVYAVFFVTATIGFAASIALGRFRTRTTTDPYWRTGDKQYRTMVQTLRRDPDLLWDWTVVMLEAFYTHE